MYGYRGRLGLIVPSSNTTNESEFWRWIPNGVSVHTARMQLEDVNEAQLVEMAADVETCISMLKTADVDAIAFGCTTGSLVKGKGYDEQIQATIETEAGVPAVATSTAIRRAFDILDARSLAIATPYTESMNEREKEFLEENGYRITEIVGLDIEPNTEIGQQTPSTAYRLAADVNSTAADAVFISCTNFRTFEIIPQLEADLGKPVVTSNSATLWASLNLLDVSAEEVNLGTLFERSLL
ncbi:maleate cis-trans isomerase family protein [Haladaptatus halobius]|uniref:maleate cis-trans isomerase family protein n=1 Tax=Haladaptatus halobius TaxID=2884875 RepID=UPI001D0ADABB|nr:maleate cis-trans isomerase [Haladaptatus halobius]